MKKEYVSPKISPYFQSKEMAFPVVAAPLAIFSTSTAAAAVVGTVAGAAATAKVLGDDISRCKMKRLQQISGYM